MIKALLSVLLVHVISGISFSQSYANFELREPNSQIIVNAKDTIEVTQDKVRIKLVNGLNFLENIKPGFIPKTHVFFASRVSGPNYSFDELVEIPSLTDAQTRIILNRIVSDSAMANFDVSLFENYKDYESGREPFTFNGVNGYLGLNWERLENDLLNFLEEERLSNTSDQNGLSIANNTSRLNIDVMAIELTRIRDVLVVFNLKVKFTLLDLTFKEITSSIIEIPQRFSKDSNISKYFILSLEEGLCEFIKNAQDQKLLDITEDDNNDFTRLTNIRPPEEDFTQFADARKAVVTVITEKGHGSGCTVTEDGIVLTNFHVIADCDTIRVVTFNSDTLTCQVLMLDPILDIAVLDIEVLTRDYFKIKSNDLFLGEPLYAIGTPLDLKLSHSISKGVFSANLTLNGIDYIQTDAEINGGNSGGALVNSKGQLIGIVNAKAVGILIEGIGFAISTKSILEKINISYK